MAKSVVKFEGFGFWVPDLFLEVLYCLIYKDINEKSTDITNKEYFIEQIEYGVCGAYSGAIDFNFDDFSMSQLLELKQIILNVYKELIFLDLIIDYDVNEVRNVILNENESYFDFGHLNTQNLRKTLLWLLLLLDRNLNIKPSDDVYYWSHSL